MKTKKERKFAFDKFEVATLKNSTMRKINGGVGNDNDQNTYSITDVANGPSSKKCS